ncbi:hypothetical protein [Paraburkholderia silvatlantica]|uniref:Lipoprotein n=1 Tax=Paraburkholderia silvatlantica TaxID=321895 RepID=A0A2U1AFB7_9BURK|nr:hypothetical protein [Paraburkholderia silvatlantica]MBB2929645.1 hypothetical protein [Paraburkholderia silvatlantica]PVY35056.1 hypothetical protein C7411_106243 [Paraburkholderia silvatlantica]PXW39466.1 hypothetical protein C7413_106243 [Paraburkholderia silvatlantica]PYE23319.1 hypothetical protein C7410_108219 [Paraburkholderia silvatlantica]TDQ78353.1 hypothetical protein C7412_13213 [Paraburkholderia silvatlantica]
MRAIAMIGAAVLLAGCVGAPPGPEGGGRAPSLAALQQMCGGQAVDFGAYAPGVYAAIFDAWVANRRGRLPQDQFCGFQAQLAQQYTALGKSGNGEARGEWVNFLNAQRAQALSWRAAADPTLRAG